VLAGSGSRAWQLLGIVGYGLATLEACSSFIGFGDWEEEEEEAAAEEAPQPLATKGKFSRVASLRSLNRVASLGALASAGRGTNMKRVYTVPHKISSLATAAPPASPLPRVYSVPHTIGSSPGLMVHGDRACLA